MRLMASHKVLKLTGMWTFSTHHSQMQSTRRKVRRERPVGRSQHFHLRLLSTELGASLNPEHVEYPQAKERHFLPGSIAGGFVLENG
jgi:hypothetical protein